MIGGDDHERDLHPPVGGIGGMGHPGDGAEIDIVPPGQAGKIPPGGMTQFDLLIETFGKLSDRLTGRRKQFDRLQIAVGALVELIEPVLQGVDQRLAPWLVVQQVILQIGIAGYHPHIPEDFEQHARGTTGTPTAAELLDEFPHRFAQKPDHDLPV